MLDNTNTPPKPATPLPSGADFLAMERVLVWLQSLPREHSYERADLSELLRLARTVRHVVGDHAEMRNRP